MLGNSGDSVWVKSTTRIFPPVRPEANSDSHESYRAKLERQGFVGVRITSIREQVYPGLHAFMARDPSMLRRFHWLARLPYYLMLRFDADAVYSAYDYVLVEAEKPKAG